MFRIDRSLRIPHPGPLFGASDDLEYYPVVELVLNVPIWVLQALEGSRTDCRSDQGALPRWRRVLVRDIDDALEMASFPQWSQVRLHVIWPDYYNEDGQLSIERCIAVHELAEPESSNERLPRLVTTVKRRVIHPEEGDDSLNVKPGRLLWEDAEQLGA